MEKWEQLFYRKMGEMIQTHERNEKRVKRRGNFREVKGEKYEKNEQNGEIFNRYRENNRENDGMNRKDTVKK